VRFQSRSRARPRRAVPFSGSADPFRAVRPAPAGVVDQTATIELGFPIPGPSLVAACRWLNAPGWRRRPIVINARSSRGGGSTLGLRKRNLVKPTASTPRPSPREQVPGTSRAFRGKIGPPHPQHALPFYAFGNYFVIQLLRGRMKSPTPGRRRRSHADRVILRDGDGIGASFGTAAMSSAAPSRSLRDAVGKRAKAGQLHRLTTPWGVPAPTSASVVVFWVVLTPLRRRGLGRLRRRKRSTKVSRCPAKEGLGETKPAQISHEFPRDGPQQLASAPGSSRWRRGQTCRIRTSRRPRPPGLRRRSKLPPAERVLPAPRAS